MVLIIAVIIIATILSFAALFAATMLNKKPFYFSWNHEMSRPQPPGDPLYGIKYIYWGLPAVGAASRHGSLLDKRIINTIINTTITILIHRERYRYH